MLNINTHTKLYSIYYRYIGIKSLKTQTAEYASKLPNIVKKIKDLIELKEPTRELIMNIIDKIVVDKDRNVEIFYKFSIVESDKLTNTNK